jgi:hypothetical protein
VHVRGAKYKLTPAFAFLVVATAGFLNHILVV